MAMLHQRPRPASGKHRGHVHPLRHGTPPCGAVCGGRPARATRGAMGPPRATDRRPVDVPDAGVPTETAPETSTMSLAHLQDLTGRVALVTGGSRGLGLQMAEALGELGAKVALTARKQGELDEAAKHLGEKGIQVLTIAGDLSHFEGIPKMVDVVLGKFGGIDILVNNAGTTCGAPAESYPAEAWKKVMDLNINAMFFLTQDVGRRSMIPKRSGKIINVAS